MKLHRACFVYLLMIAVPWLLSSCVGATKNAGVAVPSISTSSVKSKPGKVSALPSTVAVLPFTNRTQSDAAFEVVRRTIFNHFASKNYHTLHWKDVDARLKAAGLDSAAKIDAASPKSLADTLGVDGLLYGEITHYDKVFLGVYSQVSVGVRLRFVDRDGHEIWSGEDVVRSHAGGISTTPVGLILDVIAAAYHTRDIELFRAADDLGREMIPKIPEPARLAGQTPPKIMQVVHDGVGRVLKYGDTLSIAMQGEPGKHGYARINGLKTIDLTESQPGFYTAKYNVAPGDNVDGAAVIGVLADDSGLQSEWTCPLGLLYIDTTPPAAPANIQAVNVREGIRLSWDISGEKDVAGYEVMVSDQAQGPFTKLADTKDVSYLDTAAKAFGNRYYRVVSIDRAGNRGESSTIAGMLLPDARLATAVALPETLPASIDGVAVLRSGHSYKLDGTTEVAADGVLLIEPGVSIEAGSNGSLKVSGELRSFGTADKPIRISGGNRALVLAGDKPVVLQGVTVDGAAIAISVMAGSPQISDCVLIHNRFSAMEISGVSRPQVTGCRLQGASSGGVLIMGKAQPRFSGCSFRDLKPFHIQSSSAYRIDARGNNWEPAASAATILGDVDYGKTGE